MVAATTCAVGERDGMVVLEFPESVSFATFDPETARQIGEAIAKQAYHAHTGKNVPDGRSIIADSARDKLIVRVAHMLRSLRNKKLDYQAKQLVDTILSEVS